MSNPSVFTSIVLDNTLAQSAYAWLAQAYEGRPHPFIDPRAKLMATEYLAALTRFDFRYHVRPKNAGSAPHLKEPLIKYWQDRSETISYASEHATDQDNLWDRFAQSAATAPSDWAGWVTFQWTKLIVPAFKFRVGDGPDKKWRLHLADALDTVRSHHAERRISELRAQLARSLQRLKAAGQLDVEYESLVQKTGALSDLGIAYAWNWFSRGNSYQGSAPGKSVRFHDLRGGAIDLPEDGVKTISDSKLLVDYGPVVTDLVADGFLLPHRAHHEADEKFDTALTHFLTVLCHVLADRSNSHADLVAQAEAASSPQEADAHLRRAIAVALANKSFTWVEPLSEMSWLERLRRSPAALATKLNYRAIVRKANQMHPQFLRHQAAGYFEQACTLNYFVPAAAY